MGLKRKRINPCSFELEAMPANSEKEHLSIVICGHVDSGKSTTTGRLIFELGGIPERELEKLKAEAERLGKSSFAFAFYMDRQKEERERGVTIACTTKEFFTEKWQGDWWQEDGGSSLFEVQRDGGVLLPTSAAIGVRHLQELRRPFSCRFHGWQRGCHVGQGHQL